MESTAQVTQLLTKIQNNGRTLKFELVAQVTQLLTKIQNNGRTFKFELVRSLIHFGYVYFGGAF